MSGALNTLTTVTACTDLTGDARQQLQSRGCMQHFASNCIKIWTCTTSSVPRQSAVGFQAWLLVRQPTGQLVQWALKHLSYTSHCKSYLRKTEQPMLQASSQHHPDIAIHTCPQLLWARTIAVQGNGSHTISRSWELLSTISDSSCTDGMTVQADTSGASNSTSTARQVHAVWQLLVHTSTSKLRTACHARQQVRPALLQQPKQLAEKLQPRIGTAIRHNAQRQGRLAPAPLLERLLQCCATSTEHLKCQKLWPACPSTAQQLGSNRQKTKTLRGVWLRVGCRAAIRQQHRRDGKCFVQLTTKHLHRPISQIKARCTCTEDLCNLACALQLPQPPGQTACRGGAGTNQHPVAYTTPRPELPTSPAHLTIVVQARIVNEACSDMFTPLVHNMSAQRPHIHDSTPPHVKMTGTVLSAQPHMRQPAT
jgi:hypothetical protein